MSGIKLTMTVLLVKCMVIDLDIQVEQTTWQSARVAARTFCTLPALCDPLFRYLLELCDPDPVLSYCVGDPYEDPLLLAFVMSGSVEACAS
jgi:hypothetical protein